MLHLHADLMLQLVHFKSLFYVLCAQQYSLCETGGLLYELLEKVVREAPFPNSPAVPLQDHAHFLPRLLSCPCWELAIFISIYFTPVYCQRQAGLQDSLPRNPSANVASAA